MPLRTDIDSVLLLGAGPIVIGQACEFDYSGSQACRALREEGIRIVLLNSNPATIMTDPQMADATYIEPVTPEVAAEILAKEQVDAILPTMGGQTALNCVSDMHRQGILAKYGTKVIGAEFSAIRAAEDREEFRDLMTKIGVATARSSKASTLEQALGLVEQFGGFPLIVRPSFTLGGSGSGIAYNQEQFSEICSRGLYLSPVNNLLIEECLEGWKEFELEVVRDRNDNCIVICGIENTDPLGIHTGDSITIAPILTLTDKEYQLMRDTAFKVIRAIGVDTGGANVQFAVDPKTGRQLVIEMNPRVSRSSALASKATGFPIAKISTKLALGYTLDELRNEITSNKTPASFEPTIDYVVTKIPRFDFAKFPQTSPRLGTQMKSIGEVMAIGRTFKESLQKAICSLEAGYTGLDQQSATLDEALTKLREQIPYSVLHVADACRFGADTATIHAHSNIDPWFINEIAYLVKSEAELRTRQLADINPDSWQQIKRAGFSDLFLSKVFACSETEVRNCRTKQNVTANYKRVDSCAAEFPTSTAYMYSTYGEHCEAEPTSRKKIMILGSGPNRIGQGIEFDYCCIHAALALREQGFETIMVNNNPETVSTDYDISDRLYFEPLTVENVLNIIKVEKPHGIIVHYGGQTPLALAHSLVENGAPLIGTSVAAIDRAEDRDQFRKLLNKLKLRQPNNAILTDIAQGLSLGKELGNYLSKCSPAMLKQGLLLDKFLDDAIEVDVDAICDGERIVIAGILEHIEKAGVHSGDSSCALPPHTISTQIVAELTELTKSMALELGVVGLLNIQFAIQNDDIYVLEINPRASRTVPFISKATGLPVARIGALCMAGESLANQGCELPKPPTGFFVKEAVFPFDRMPGTDTLLGPEMRSTGEVMGSGSTFASAFLRATESILPIPMAGTVLMSVRDRDKPAAVKIARTLTDCGMSIAATAGTADFLLEHGDGIPVTTVRKVNEKPPTVVDAIKDGEIKVVINTVTPSTQAVLDSVDIRSAALTKQVLYFTTIDSATVIAEGIQEKLNRLSHSFEPLQQRLRLLNH